MQVIIIVSESRQAVSVVSPLCLDDARRSGYRPANIGTVEEEQARAVARSIAIRRGYRYEPEPAIFVVCRAYHNAQ